MRRAWIAILVAAMWSAATAEPANKTFDALISAYPDKIAGFNLTEIVWRDGARQALGPEEPDKSFDRLVSDASIRDMFRMRYPAFAPLAAPPEDFDPGRFRNKAFFDRLYGDCRKGEVAPDLVDVEWLPASWGHKVRIARRAADALRAVSAEIEKLPQWVRRAAYPTAGTYVCRGVADRGQPSMHAYGAAIDLNLDYSDYWLWQTHGATPLVWRNRMPPEIVTAFERHGFIWGGRWYHYDTMHFEYRPELNPH
ncbi:MAG: M15 family metallopeptidase [Alphaproteobacteria bacterium]|nr:M15 family metallopeptidase [Alphaproteobacteria bacterium]